MGRHETRGGSSIEDEESDFSGVSEIELDFGEDGEGVPALGPQRVETGESPTSTRQRLGNFKVFGPEELFPLLEQMVKEAVEILGIDASTTEYLLRSYKWKTETLVHDWVDSAEKVLQKTGAALPPAAYRKRSSLPPREDSTLISLEKEEPLSDDRGVFFCPVMVMEVPYSETRALACRHRFSNVCWVGYLTAALDDGRSCLNKKCVKVDCGMIIPFDWWQELLPPELYSKVQDYRVKSFVEENQRMCWCIAPGCDRAIALYNSFGEVKCDCGTKFCFYCREERHYPVPCEIIEKWKRKNQNEADNITWILVNTKSCPSCRLAIEKNQGCMHMTCRCGHEFCWMCLGDWKKHQTASFYRCNVYESRTDRDEEAAESQRRQARMSLEKYAHYFERYRFHNSNQQQAEETFKDRVRAAIAELHSEYPGLTEDEFFDAIDQLIDSRRVLKWSFAFAYFQDWSNFPAQKDLFEYHQGQLEWTLDKLHTMIVAFVPGKLSTFIPGPEPTEKNRKSEIDAFLPEGACADGVGAAAARLELFKASLVNTTRVVRDFFGRMAEAFDSEFITKSGGGPLVSGD